MSPASLKLAGYCAMFSAFVTLPSLYLAYSIGSSKDMQSELIVTTIEVFGTVLSIILLLCLRRFFNRLLAFSGVNRHIDLFMIFGVLSAGFSISTLVAPELKQAVNSTWLVLMALQGLVQMNMGYTLLKAPFSLGGMLRPFCFLTMATGILSASILLLPFAVVISAITDLLLGTLFLGTARQSAAMVKRSGSADR